MIEQTFSPEAEAALYASLEPIAQKHADRSGGTLMVLPHDIVEYPGQALGCHWVPGDLKDPATTYTIGSQAIPDFVEQSHRLVNGRNQQTGWSLREETEGLLVARKSLILATDHDDITSPAYPLGAVSNGLREANEERPDETKVAFESGIIVSKVLPLLAYKFGDGFIPCMSVLQWMCDRVYLSYPQTKTFMEADFGKVLPPNHIRDHNDRLKADIKRWLAAGGALLGISFLGSTHTRLEGGRVQQLDRVSRGSGQMGVGEDVYVMPVNVDLTGPEHYMEQVGPVRQFETWEDVNPMSEEMAAARTARNRKNGSNILCVYQTAEQAAAERAAA